LQTWEHRVKAQTPSIDLPRWPWWRVPVVWLVLGGPALVVVASFVTLALALARPDPVLPLGPAAGSADTPAVQARNHAANPAPRGR
jgi:uncharacterized protein